MKYALKNMYLLDGHADMKPVAGKAVLVSDGRIRAIVEESEAPKHYETVDLHGGYLLPGLINLHVHTPLNGKPAKKKMDYAGLAKLLKLGAVKSVVRAMCAENVRQALFSGTTTIRTVGGIQDFDGALRDRINEGKAVGPRILAANYAVSVPGGHMTGSVALPVETPWEARQMVRDLAETKPDLIKLMITGGVLDAEVPGEPGVLKMPPEIIKAACEEAHALGYRVAAHVESTEGMLAALRNGVDSLEHGGAPTPEVLQLMMDTGAVLVGTLSPAVPFTVLDQAVTGMTDTDLLNGKALFSHMRDCILSCLEAGIPVGLGTDSGCPFITPYDMWRELWYYSRWCGVTPAFAIHSATELNAKILGIDAETGTVEEGKSADFLIVRDNPLEDLTALRQPQCVVFRGTLYKNPKIKRLTAVDTELDKLLSM